MSISLSWSSIDLMTAAPLDAWIRAQGERVRVTDSVDPASDRSSATCGAADRTIYATRAVAQDDVLVELRDGAFLNGTTWLATLASEAATQLAAKLAELQPSGTVLTALALLSEKARGESSAFHGYIQQLPVAVPLPLTWSAAEKATLQDTAAYPIMDDGLVQSVFDRFAEPLTSAFPDHWENSGVNFEDFRWAFSIVSSRAFGVSDTREPTLLPVIDMANHDPVDPAALIRKEPDGGGYSLIALRAIDAESPVTISYGDLSNAQLLCRYAFVLPDVAPSDAVLVSSAHVRVVFAHLTGGGTADGALAQLERLDQDETAARAAATAGEPAVKRRKLFDAPADDALSFALHSDAAQGFGLSDGLLDFVLAQGLPGDALDEVLRVLLQHKDKRYSALLDGDAPRLARALAALERQVCRRILLGLLTLEEGSDEEDDASEEEEEDEDEE